MGWRYGLGWGRGIRGMMRRMCKTIRCLKSMGRRKSRCWIKGMGRRKSMDKRRSMDKRKGLGRVWGRRGLMGL